MLRRITLRRVVRMGLLLTAPLLAACDDESLNSPVADAGAMFARFVAIGNSITAGFQSGGINDSTQNQSYAVLVADELGTDFVVPLLNKPGCPAPWTNVFTGDRVGGTGDTDCALRQSTPTLLHNVAVPGAAVVDALSNLDADSDPNTLTTIILGGRTQLEAAREVQPTFMSVWIGNNDVLGAALAGDASLVTDATTFATRYNAMVDSLQAMGVQGAVLIGVANVTAIPHLSPGVAYFLAAQDPAWPPTFAVAASCAPAAFGGVGEQTMVPFGYGFGVLMAQATAGTPVTLDCASDAPVLSATELQTLGTAVAAFNQTIAAAATAQGWAYLDPNPPLDSLAQAGEIPLFPNTSGADALLRPFGDFFSFDGVHPNAAAHQLIADHVMDAIEATYGG